MIPLYLATIAAGSWFLYWAYQVVMGWLPLLLLMGAVTP